MEKYSTSLLEEENVLLLAKALTNRKEFIFQQLTKLWSSIKNVQLSEVDAEIHLRTCTKHETAYEKLIDEIFKINELLEKSQKINLNDHDSFTIIIENINKKCITAKLSGQRHSENVRADANHNSNSQLPKLSVPVFDGNIAQWTEFKAQFEAIISSKNISNILKLSYLKNNLRNEPLSIVGQYPMSDDSFNLAWADLLNRYESKRRLGSHYLYKILNFKALSQSKDKEHIKYIEIHRAATAALNKVGFQDLADYILFELSYQNLSPSDQRFFDREHHDQSEPTIEHILNFVEKIAKSEELRIDKASSMSHNKEISKHQIPKKVLVNTQRLATCYLCKSDHPLYKCAKLLSLSISQRINKVRELGCCVSCLYMHKGLCKSRFSCRFCNQKSHNSILCLDTLPSTTNISGPPVQSSSSAPSDSASSSVLTCNSCTTTNQPATPQVLLGTIQCRVKDNWGDFITTRAVLDPGSELSIITSALASRLGLPKKPTTYQVQGISQSVSKPVGNLSIQLQDMKSSFSYQLEAAILPTICDQLPRSYLSSELINKYHRLDLADPAFHRPGNIHILLGADAYSDLLSTIEPSIIPGQPSAIRTKFGYVIIGKVNDNLSISSNKIPAISLNITTSPLDSALLRFWESEEVQLQPESDPADVACEKHFKHTYTRDVEGRFVVRLPFLPDALPIGCNEPRALQSLNRLERRLQNNEFLSNEYSKCLNEYITLGHMVPCSSEFKYLLPHHAVLKQSSSTTKVRVVFDCSSSDNLGYSLNDRLYRGASLLSDISSLLINFRMFKVCVVADIKMMYRMVSIHPDDRKNLIVAWRADNNPSCHTRYQMTRLVFGMKPAGFLASRCIIELADLYHKEYPEAAKAVYQYRYMDDFCSGASNPHQARELQRQLTELLAKGGFEIRRWSSNVPEALSNVPADCLEAPITLPTGEVGVKVLGVMWDQISDSFVVRIISFESDVISKRTVLSYIAKIYDVMGLFSPVIFMAKCFLQSLWLERIGWDETLSPTLCETWREYATDLESLSSFKVPRYIPMNDIVRLVGFADASEKGMGACVYLHCNNISYLLKSKSKLAPLKTLTIPRLELSAALLLSQLVKSIVNHCNVKFVSINLYTDSMCVLGWLQRPLHELKIFISNRVAQIQSLTPAATWSHVRSLDNPADLLSRGVKASRLKTAEIWWQGPNFLKNHYDQWPITTPSMSLIKHLPDIKKSFKVLNIKVLPQEEVNDEILRRFSSLTRMQRVLAFIKRFFYNCRNPRKARNGPLSVQELEDSLHHAVRISQLQDFGEEIRKLTYKVPIDKGLNRLSPFIDTKSLLLKVGGRLSRANFLPESTKHPLLLSKGCHLSYLIANHYHSKLLHSGPRTTCSNIQKKFWIISVMSLVKKIIYCCKICHRLNAKPAQPLMADVIPDRLMRTHCWASCAIDFGGPFATKESRIKSSKIHKSYICVFVCMTTRAIHIELVNDLTADGFTAAFQRFVSRRSAPTVIYSDRGTNFIATRRVLKECREFLSTCQDTLFSVAAAVGTRWVLNPPYGGNFNTCAENGIKSCKSLLRKQVGDRILTFEEFNTLLCRVEQVLNSRPISFSSADINDQEILYLTPGHFIIGRDMMTPPEKPIDDNMTVRDRWRSVQQLSQVFWTTWSTAYLQELMQRNKWSKATVNLKVGDLVYITGIKTSPLSWPIGRIEETFTNPDDSTVRVAKIFSRGRYLIRPVNKLVIIPTV